MFAPIEDLEEVDQTNVSRVLVLSYARSGSSFVGDLLQQNERTFYSYEPLFFMGHDSPRFDETATADGVDTLEKILSCDFTGDGMVSYLDDRQNSTDPCWRWNRFLRNKCRWRSPACFDPCFVRAVCLRARIQVVKTIRVGSRHLIPLLEKLPNLKVLFLIRDPRGVINSRNALHWCQRNPNCVDAKQLCAMIDRDMQDLNAIRKRFPSRIFMLRYIHDT